MIMSFLLFSFVLSESMLFELNDESYISNPSEDSHEWDSEQSLMEEESSGDFDNASLDTYTTESSAMQSNFEFKDSTFACLSSLCPFGNSVSCQASETSPSRYSSYCSCQKSHHSTSSSSSPSSSSSSSSSASPSSVLLSPSSSLSKALIGIYENSNKLFSSLTNVKKLSPSSSAVSSSHSPFYANQRSFDHDRSNASKPFCITPARISGFSSVYTKSMYAAHCDTQDTSHSCKSCDFNSMESSLTNRSHSHISSCQFLHITSSNIVVKDICNYQSSNSVKGNLEALPSGSNSIPHNEAGHSNVHTLKQNLNISGQNDLSSNVDNLEEVISFKCRGRKKGNIQRQSFTRLAASSVTSFPISNASNSQCFPDEHSNESPLDIVVPFTPETGSDKYLHTHFTRLNSAMKMNESDSSESCPLVGKLSLHQTSAKRCRFEPSRLSFHNEEDSSTLRNSAKSSKVVNEKESDSDRTFSHDRFKSNDNHVSVRFMRKRKC